MCAAFALFPAFRNRILPIFDPNHFVAINSENSRFMKGYIKCGFSFCHRGFFGGEGGGVRHKSQVRCPLPLVSPPPAAVGPTRLGRTRTSPQRYRGQAPFLRSGTQGEQRGPWGGGVPPPGAEYVSPAGSSPPLPGGGGGVLCPARHPSRWGPALGCQPEPLRCLERSLVAAHTHHADRGGRGEWLTHGPGPGLRTHWSFAMRYSPFLRFIFCVFFLKSFMCCF